MCGIFGIISKKCIDKKEFKFLVEHSQQRGKDSSGLVFPLNNQYYVYRADFTIKELLKEVNPYKSSFAMGHSRLITNGLTDNQPVVRDGICLIHNGIVVNHEDLWGKINKKRKNKNIIWLYL